MNQAVWALIGLICIFVLGYLILLAYGDDRQFDAGFYTSLFYVVLIRLILDLVSLI